MRIRELLAIESSSCLIGVELATADAGINQDTLPRSRQQNRTTELKYSEQQKSNIQKDIREHTPERKLTTHQIVVTNMRSGPSFVPAHFPQ